jgi:26S proteasome regulatory subunit N1
MLISTRMLRKSTSRLSLLSENLGISLTLLLQAGALLAIGILNCGVRTEADAALALLGDYVENKSVPLKTSSITGLGLAYAGSHREDLSALLLPSVADDGVSMEIASLASLSLGFIFVGSANGEITSTILQTMMERDDKALEEKWARFLALGLALLYLGLLSCWLLLF